MTVGIKIRDQIDEMRRTGKTPLDIADFVGTMAMALERQNTFESDDRTIQDSQFGSAPPMPRSTRQAICPKCDGKLVPTRNPKTNERVLICSTCGNKQNPKIEPVTFATNITTVEGFRRRKMGSAKLSGKTGSGNVVSLEQEETSRDLYSDRSSITKKKITITGDDKRLEEGSGRSITSVTQIDPS